jgi:uncharacterized protein YhjY with autotransporter beta-barrel domain
MSKRARFSFFSGFRLLVALLCLAGALPVSADTLSVSITAGEGGVVGANQFQTPFINCNTDGGTPCFADNFEPIDGGVDDVTLSASGSFGWVFDGWGGSCSGLDPCLVSLNAATQNQFSVSASFIPDLNVSAVLSVSVSGGGSGTVVDNLQSINCPGDCSEVIPQPSSQSITLTATPAAGTVFVGWEGGSCSGASLTCNLVLNPGLFDVIAVFEPDSDGDGVFDPADACPGTAAGEAVDTSGCSAPQLDDDGDNVSNDVDTCPGTPTGEAVDTSGCSASQLDDDGDNFNNDVDACPATPTGEAVDAIGCGASQLDDDDDAVSNAVDECPATAAGTEVDAVGCPVFDPPVFTDIDGDGVLDFSDDCPGTPSGEAVNLQGCSGSQLDDDGDDVNNDVDACPATPTGEAVDALGCSDSQLDDDDDNVSNFVDACLSTPAGEAVDASGCSDSQLDEDGDGVNNVVDECASTPAGEDVDAAGCSDSQRDDDADGVPNGSDQCPNTPTDEEADAAGCSDSQRDDDADGVPNGSDQCPNTPTDDEADGTGCSNAQKDSDGDGVSDADDSCPATDPDTTTGPDGCSEVQEFGEDLGSLSGLTGGQSLLGSRIDEICPLLIEASDELAPGEQELRVACSRLKNRETTEGQAVTALQQIILDELSSQQGLGRDLFSSLFRRLGKRLDQLNAGGGGGVSVSGLNFRAGGQAVSGQVLQSAFEELLGMGAGEDSFADFGKLGVFIQGDFDFGDKDESELESGYDFDSWNFTLGADYRFTDSVYAGASIGIGEADVDYAGNGGDSQLSTVTLSAYGGWQLSENWYVDGLLSYGQTEYDTKRHIRYSDVLGSFESTQLSDTDGDQVYFGLNTGYMLSRGGWRFGPTASFSYLDSSIDGYTESAAQGSSSAWNFIVEDQDFESMRFSVGGQADYVINTSFGVLVPGVRAAYVYEAEDAGENIVLRLANNPFAQSSLVSDEIIVTTADRDSNFVDVSINLSGQFVMGFSGYLSYQFYSAYDDYSQDGYTVGLRWDKPF